MTTNGFIIGDGSWNLQIYVSDLQVERTLRVKGDLHIGGVMLRLVEDLDIAMDWSDHALWWPTRNSWLTRTRSTLDQYGVQADAKLQFTRMHKTARIQLPDLRYIDMRVDYSIKTFNAVIQICKELNIRHPEELSLCKPLEAHHLKQNLKQMHYNGSQVQTPVDTNTFIANSQSPSGSVGSLDMSSSPFICAPLKNHSTPVNSPVSHNGTWKKSYSKTELNGNVTSLEMLNGSLDTSLANSPSPNNDIRNKMLRPKSLIEKARMNVAWLDSSLSIMEQGIREFDTLKLRFKFYSFYDLNPRLDSVRINQIYEQAKWSLLNGEIDCTEEEAFMFAALQLQINLKAGVPQPLIEPVGGEDDIDAALSDLQITLEGFQPPSSISSMNYAPELSDYLRFFKPKKFTLKAFKRYWFTCRDLHLRMYKTAEEAQMGAPPVHSVSLKGCEVTPDVNISQNKFGIKLEVPSSDGMTEMCIRCDTEEQYAKWMAACRIAAKGRPLSINTYESEVKSIKAFLEMQHPAVIQSPVISPSSLDINTEDYIPHRYARKLKGKLVQRVLEAHSNVKDLNLMEAKMNYIKAWQSLPEFGISLFVVKFMGHKKDELLGIAYNRLMRMDISTGDHIKTWRFNTMKAWNINWEVKHMMVQFEEGNIIFACQSADCKVIHEFIGGYIFCSMRSKEANQTLNEELFHKLTGGWS
ncbi:unc-112-related protein-like [Daktulosphaira vitifoliae]|uniref:unc-112-related protein-like n=1 Tax=Daktulosphaira vitifoliae TaxID=58002 RepID=UPI0021AB09E4|nr:unc-112-related protein-like [Daktulosphaira vitifoliae]